MILVIIQVKRIIQSDQEIGKMKMEVSPLIAKMTELFVTELLHKAQRLGGDLINKECLASVIREDDR